MDVLNFGHGVFIAVGAFVATSRAGRHGQGWTANLAELVAQLCCSSVIVPWQWSMLRGSAAVIGIAFERFIVRPVYGQHLQANPDHHGRNDHWRRKLIKVIWGPQQIPLELAFGNARLAGSWAMLRISKYRLIAVVVGLLVVFGRFGLDAERAPKSAC